MPRIRVFTRTTHTILRAYLKGVIENLYESGTRYLKFDYNDSYYEADGKHDGLKENAEAVRLFYREIKMRFPDLKMENCASGGKRSANVFLREFDLQSISDQEIYYRYPSIIAGSLVNSLPEKTGIWAMPQPVLFGDRNKINSACLSPSDEEVIFNLVNGMTGVMTLGSMIDRLSKKHFALVKEGVETYRKLFRIIKNAYPVYPIGLTHIRSDQHALLWKGEDEEILFLWATGNAAFQLDDASSFRQIFPKKCDSLITEGRIVLKSDVCARIFASGSEKSFV